MRILYFKECTLSSKASELVQFDIDSIRHVAAARHGKFPALWLTDPEQYERNGRVLRDSTTPRLLAYSPEEKILYVTDGCNSCAHELSTDLATLAVSQLESFARNTGIRLELLERLAASTSC